MSVVIDETHDPQLASWVESANDPGTDFPIQNLPFGRFRTARDADWRIGVAIGDQVLDLAVAGLTDTQEMNALMAAGPRKRAELRRALSRGLSRGSAERGRWATALRAQSDIETGLPCAIGDYTDFYAGIHHATTVGKLFRPDNPLLPNYKWVPIGYHGRASSIGVSGQRFHRPRGQVKPADASAPTLLPTARLDYELEFGAVIGTGNVLGEAVGIEEAESHVFGFVLLNDWSARDVQAWEYQPLGPFLAKNFATTISPWLVTPEALAPFRAPFERMQGDPQPLPYLDSATNRARGAIDISLEVWLLTEAMKRSGTPPLQLSRSNLRDAYWTVAQLIAHHTVNGCNLQPGDLLGSGTISGPALEQAGSLLELTQNGNKPIALAHGERRTFLEDGDTVILRAHCERAGFRRIGFGDCAGTVLPAKETR
jgi:fumarylacetoacetase